MLWYRYLPHYNSVRGIDGRLLKIEYRATFHTFVSFVGFVIHVLVLVHVMTDYKLLPLLRMSLLLGTSLETR